MVRVTLLRGRQLCTCGHAVPQRMSGPPNSATRPATLTAELILQTQLRHRSRHAARPSMLPVAHCARARAGPRQAAYVICSRLGLSVTLPGLFLEASWRASCGGMFALLSSRSRLRS